MKLNLQYFGGGGAGLGNGNDGGGSVMIRDEVDVWSYRHNPKNQAFADDIIQSASDMQNDFPDLMSETLYDITAADIGPHTGILGFYSRDSKSMSLNQEFTNPNKMNHVYDKATEAGYHPSRGDKSGTQAVAYHEMGHALTDNLVGKMGVRNLDKAAERVVKRAYTQTKGKGGTKAWAGNISGYAQESYSECVAEAVSDYYCNGRNAKAESKAIMSSIRYYYK